MLVVGQLHFIFFAINQSPLGGAEAAVLLGCSGPSPFDLPEGFHGILGLTCPLTSNQKGRAFWVGVFSVSFLLLRASAWHWQTLWLPFCSLPLSYSARLKCRVQLLDLLRSL